MSVSLLGDNKHSRSSLSLLSDPENHMVYHVNEVRGKGLRGDRFSAQVQVGDKELGVSCGR